MTSKTLFVLAAGMGSRYGGLKQMEGFGPNGETIIDYSLYDAHKAGFNRFMFVIRPDMEEAFNEIFVDKYKGKLDIEYVFQTVDMIPEWYERNPERVKPWGTGHALLTAKDEIKEPFFLITSDDFYGEDAFKVAIKFLENECKEDLYGIPVYDLKNVLSDYGSVKRGICYEENGYLVNIEETFEVERDESGVIKGITMAGKNVTLEDNTPTAMSSYVMHPSVFANFEKRFDNFLKNLKDDLTDEYLIPEVLRDMIEEDGVKVKTLRSKGEWFGITHKEDAEIVREKLKNMVEQGMYPEKLEVF